LSNSGNEAEKMAATYLQQQGLTLLETNYRCRFGEIDLIMRDGNATVFVEVRLRSNADFGGAGMSITPHKQQKLVRAAEHYLLSHSSTSCRFDAVLMDKIGAQHIEWIRNAFDA
jgi:putative endonuclease